MSNFERYVAIGDSTTEGLFDPDGNGGNRGWADRLAEHLAARQPRLLYANLAVRGRLTAEIHAEQLGPALDLEPDLVSVVAGMNDVLRPSFEPQPVLGSLEEMIRALRGTGATVLTATFGDPVPVNPYARVLRRRMASLNAGIRAAARRHGAVLVDFDREPVASDPRLWCEDRLHANSDGHERIAGACAQALGLEVEGPPWNEPLSPRPRARRKEFIVGEIAWARRHLAPWVVRRIKKVSSGDGVSAKRPHLAPVITDVD